MSIIDPFVARNILDDDVAVRSFRPTVPFEVAAVLPSRAGHHAHVDEFVSLVRSRFREQLAPGVP